MQPQYSPAVLTRFWSKINRDGPIHPYRPELGPCWLWTAGTNAGGYGTFGLNGRSVLAHRFIHEHLIGPIPAGLCALHSCDNPPCVNPAHLFVGTRTDNNKDKGRKRRGRSLRGDEHWARRRPEVLRRGERHPRATFTEAQIRQIRSIYSAGGVSIRAIAARFGSNENTVGCIVHRKTWKHL